MKLFLPILDNGQGDIKADFLDCFIEAFSGLEITTLRFSDSHPDRARNRVAAHFLRTDCTHLLFIDGDIKFFRRHIELLAESEAAILGGIYCLKTADAVRPCLQTLPGHVACETGGYLPVARTGTGFLRISREVFEAMKATADRYTNHGLEEWNFFGSGVVNEEWCSEDWAFCDRARALGFEILIDTRVQLLHRGELDFPLQVAPDRLDLCPPAMKPHLERIWQGEYEIPLDPPPATVLDLGGNIGGFTKWAAERWPGASIEAFEPHPDNVALFRLNTRHLNGRVSLAEVAVVGDDRPLVMTLSEGANNCGEHSLHFAGAHGTLVSTFPARVVGSAEFVKIDTEGCELEILQALDLSATRALALEYHTAGDRDEIRRLVDRAGFTELAHEAIAADRGILKFARPQFLNPDARK